MEYANKGCLSDMLKKDKPFGLDSSINIIFQIRFFLLFFFYDAYKYDEVCGVKIIHENDLVHSFDEDIYLYYFIIIIFFLGDLKPDNILLHQSPNSPFVLKIADFGFIDVLVTLFSS
jgi:serine/threonine protein kinase